MSDMMTVEEHNRIVEQTITAMDAERVSFEQEIAEIQSSLGCHRAYIIQSINDLKAATENIPNIDRLRQAQQEIARLREANAGPQCHCPCCAKTWLPKWQFQLQQIT